MSLMLTGCALAADIDLGEGYHVPSGFSSVLITSSDGTAIQNAVDHIQSGGVIYLSGDFKLKKDSINIKKNLTLEGVEDAVAILDRSTAPKSDRVIRCQGDITLKNLTIISGDSTNGGGVKLDGGKVKIISCDIHGNRGLLGGGIHSQADELELTSCDISNNTSLSAGGGMSAIGGKITMINCKITSNDATNLYGGGIALINPASVTSSDCVISDNTAKASDDIYIK